MKHQITTVKIFHNKEEMTLCEIGEDKREMRHVFSFYILTEVWKVQSK